MILLLLTISLRRGTKFRIYQNIQLWSPRGLHSPEFPKTSPKAIDPKVKSDHPDDWQICLHSCGLSSESRPGFYLPDPHWSPQPVSISLNVPPHTQCHTVNPSKPLLLISLTCSFLCSTAQAWAHHSPSGPGQRVRGQKVFPLPNSWSQVLVPLPSPVTSSYLLLVSSSERLSFGFPHFSHFCSHWLGLGFSSFSRHQSPL